MRMHLIKKDIIAGRNTIIGLAAIFLAMDNFFIFHDNSWGPFIRIGCGQILFLVGYYALMDKWHHGEYLICSLPVSRRDVVIARYASAFLLGIFGLALIIANAYLLNTLFNRLPGDLFAFLNLPLCLTFVLFLVLFISIFMPMTFRLDAIWITVVIGYGIVLILILGMRYVDAMQMAEESPRWFAFLLSAILISGLLYFSGELAMKYYNKRDL